MCLHLYAYNFDQREGPSDWNNDFRDNKGSLNRFDNEGDEHLIDEKEQDVDVILTY